MGQDLIPFTYAKKVACLDAVDDRIRAYPHSSMLVDIAVRPAFPRGHPIRNWRPVCQCLCRAGLLMHATYIEAQLDKGSRCRNVRWDHSQASCAAMQHSPVHRRALLQAAPPEKQLKGLTLDMWVQNVTLLAPSAAPLSGDAIQVPPTQRSIMPAPACSLHIRDLTSSAFWLLWHVCVVHEWSSIDLREVQHSAFGKRTAADIMAALMLPSSGLQPVMSLTRSSLQA